MWIKIAWRSCYYCLRLAPDASMCLILPEPGWTRGGAAKAKAATRQLEGLNPGMAEKDVPPHAACDGLLAASRTDSWFFHFTRDIMLPGPNVIRLGPRRPQTSSLPTPPSSSLCLVLFPSISNNNSQLFQKNYRGSGGKGRGSANHVDHSTIGMPQPRVGHDRVEAGLGPVSGLNPFSSWMRELL